MGHRRGVLRRGGMEELEASSCGTWGGWVGGGHAELELFKHIGIYWYLSRGEDVHGSGRKSITFMWVQVNKGSGNEPEVRGTLVAQALGYGERMDERFAGAPSFTGVVLLSCRRDGLRRHVVGHQVRLSLR